MLKKEKAWPASLKSTQSVTEAPRGRFWRSTRLPGEERKESALLAPLDRYNTLDFASKAV
jgi:hypothetical protein